MNGKYNSVGEFIRIAGLIAVGLTLLGAFWMALVLESVVVALIVGIVGALQGLLLVGFGEALNLLHRIELNTSVNAPSALNRQSVSIAYREEGSSWKRSWTCPNCNNTTNLKDDYCEDTAKCSKCGCEVNLIK